MILAQPPLGKPAEMISGDLSSRDDCRRAVEGVSIMIHLTAGFEQPFAGAFMNCALTTRNLLDASMVYGGVGRFVNVSPLTIHSNLNLKGGVLRGTKPAH